MNHLRLLRWSSLLCTSLLTAVLAASCTSTHDTADVVPAPPGAFQPDGGGKLIDEATACSKLTDAESRARAALSCDKVTRDCPAYVRPAGGADCFVYDEATVDGCAALYDSFTSCADFDQRVCLVSAVSRCDVPDAGGGGGGGGSGQAGAPSAQAGATSSANEPSTGGAPEAGAAG